MTNHLLSVKDLTSEYLSDLFNETEKMKSLVQTVGGDDSLKHKVMTTYFFEASTRTSCSFQSAMLRLGGSVITVDKDTSSTKKGESFEDSIQPLACYGDVIVLRHPEVGSAARAASVSLKPIINAGDGTGEHPTQSLLDLYTIQSELNITPGMQKVDGSTLTVTFLGDLKHGRTVHSLALLLSHWFSNLRLIYVSPVGLEMPREIMHEIEEYSRDKCKNNASVNITQVETKEIDEVIGDTDVLYVTRIQKERFLSEQEYELVMFAYCVDEKLMQKAKEKMIVMHPLPRVTEIAREVDSDNRAAYFRQMENGLFVRMAILKKMLA